MPKKLKPDTFVKWNRHFAGIQKEVANALLSGLVLKLVQNRRCYSLSPIFGPGIKIEQIPAFPGRILECRYHRKQGHQTDHDDLFVFNRDNSDQRYGDKFRFEVMDGADLNLVRNRPFGRFGKIPQP